MYFCVFNFFAASLYMLRFVLNLSAACSGEHLGLPSHYQTLNQMTAYYTKVTAWIGIVEDLCSSYFFVGIRNGGISYT
jgi:hypothetical protein